MILKAQRGNLDFTKSILVGAKKSNIIAGKRVELLGWYFEADMKLMRKNICVWKILDLPA